MEEKITFTDEELRARLTPMQYYVTQEKGTERGFTGEYWNHREHGMYHCIVCNTPLFDSEAKFESGCGWPSFYRPTKDVVISEIVDRSFGMLRKEIDCATCGAHLGHVFDDGPPPTFLRYCINSASLVFRDAQT